MSSVHEKSVHVQYIDKLHVRSKYGWFRLIQIEPECVDLQGKINPDNDLKTTLTGV